MMNAPLPQPSSKPRARAQADFDHAARAVAVAPSSRVLDRLWRSIDADEAAN